MVQPKVQHLQDVEPLLLRSWLVVGDQLQHKALRPVAASRRKTSTQLTGEKCAQDGG
jgi:hypothetical protein